MRLLGKQKHTHTHTKTISVKSKFGFSEVGLGHGFCHLRTHLWPPLAHLRTNHDSHWRAISALWFYVHRVHLLQKLKNHPIGVILL